jgi:hypothetical protein
LLGDSKSSDMKRIILPGLLAGLNQFAATTPQRLPDGTVFLPKSAQRGMGVLTLKTAEAERCRKRWNCRAG